MEVYIRAITNGDIKDGDRFVGESDIVRYLRQQKLEAGEHYIKAISTVAGIYKRLLTKNVENIDELINKTIQRQFIALELEDEKSKTLKNVYGEKYRSGPTL